MVRQSINKSKLERELGVSRASLYYKPKREDIYQEVKKQIESVMVEHLDYGHFKTEAGDLSRFEMLGELIEFVYSQVYYYNHKRIHSVLKMSPVDFRKRHAV